VEKMQPPQVDRIYTITEGKGVTGTFGTGAGGAAIH
jgi:hypothetical protein